MIIDYTEVGRRIAKRRKELGLKQYEVCEMIDVNYKYLSNLETGRSSPSLELLMSLCQALDTTPDYLLIGAYKNESEALSISEKISGLNPKEISFLNGVIDLMLKQR